MVLDILPIATSVLALIVSVAAVRIARRTSSLTHEAHLELRIGRSASIAVPGGASYGGGPQYRVHNHGKGVALNLTVRAGTKTIPLGDLKGGDTKYPSVPVTPGATLKATWNTPDGKKRSRSLRPRDGE